MASDTEITAELNVDDLSTLPEDAAPEFAGPRLALSFAAKTDLGRVRENNEDKFDWWEPDDPVRLAARGRLYAVADGMGGHAAGQIAAEMALKVIGESYYGATRGTPEDALSRAIAQANTEVFDTARAIPSRKGMGCTVVLAAVVGGNAVLAWAGDSRIYLVRNGVAEQLTEDHSWVHEQVRLGALTPEEAHRSPYRNVITRCLGPEPAVQPETRREALAEGDALVLCSDGLTGVVEDHEIARFAGGAAPAFACRDLIALANERGGPDNITVAVIRVDGGSAESGPEPGVSREVPAEDAPEPPRRRGLFSRRAR